MKKNRRVEFMRKMIVLPLMVTMLFVLCACAEQELANMTTSEGQGYAAIVWDDRAYIPYCAISKRECGEQIGIVDGDKEGRVYQYKNYSTEQWIINAYTMDGAILYREVNVTEIPEGLESEYDWNHE